MPSGVVDLITGGSEDAANAQRQAIENANAMQKQMFDKQMELLEPFRAAGVDVGLAGLLDLISPEGQQQFLDDYYQSGQFLTQSDAARNQQLASAEATGGLHSTSTQNQLARIAPDLGMNALQDQMNQYGNLTNIGLSGAGAQAGYAQNYGDQYAQNQMNLGNVNAASHMANTGIIGNIVGGVMGTRPVQDFMTDIGLF